MCVYVCVYACACVPAYACACVPRGVMMKLRHVAPEDACLPGSGGENSHSRERICSPARLSFPRLPFPLATAPAPPPFSPAFSRFSSVCSCRHSRSKSPSVPSRQISLSFGILPVLDSSSHDRRSFFLSFFSLLKPASRLSLSHFIAVDNTPDCSAAVKYRAASGAIVHAATRVHAARFILLAAVFHCADTFAVHETHRAETASDLKKKSRVDARV